MLEDQGIDCSDLSNDSDEMMSRKAEAVGTMPFTFFNS
jgi:hypothetical protein